MLYLIVNLHTNFRPSGAWGSMSGLSNMGWAKHSFITICYLINLYIIIINYYYVLLSFADTLNDWSQPPTR